MRKRVFAIFLSAALVLGLMPINVLAAPDEEADGEAAAEEVIVEEVAESKKSEEAVAEEPAVEKSKLTTENPDADAENEIATLSETAEGNEDDEADEEIMTLADEENVAEVNGVTYNSLKDAIYAATSGSTVNLLKDTYIECNGSSYAVINSDLMDVTVDLNGHTIYPWDDEENYYYGGGFLFFVYDGGIQFTLKNGTIDGSMPAGGEEDPDGQKHSLVVPIYGDRTTDNPSTVTVENVTFQNINPDEGDKAIIDIQYMNLNVSGCNFLNDDLAIDAQYSGAVNITGSTFKDDVDTGDGGAIRLYDTMGEVNITGNTIDGNSSSGYGGGIGIDNPRDDAVINIEGNTISNNTASGGGGIALDAADAYDIGTLTIKNNVITGNQSIGTGSSDGGGGIFIQLHANASENTEIVIEGNTIDGNEAAKNGGGIYDYRGSAELNDNTIIDNTAANGGGVAYYDKLDMTSGVITGNTASSQGGGVYISGSRGNFNMTGGTIYGNTGTSNSADLYVSKDSSVMSLLPASEMNIDGYDGIGWFNDSSSARYVETDDPEEIDVDEMPTGSFYYMIAAYGNIVTYSVDGDTSVVAPAIIDATKGETEVTLASGDDLEAPDGYTFSSWNTAEDGSGDSYEGGASYSGPSITLYAQWEEEEEGDVAQVDGGKIYNSLAAAVEAANDGSLIELLKDVEIDTGASYPSQEVYAVIDKSMTIDLGGYTISLVDQGNSGGELFDVYDGGIQFTLKNGTIDGSMDGQKHSLVVPIYGDRTTDNPSTVTVEDVTFQNINPEEGDKAIIDVQYMNLNVSGCNFLNDDLAINCQYGGDVNITDSTFKDDVDTGDGGAIRLNETTGNIDITGNTIDGNSSSGYGGGIGIDKPHDDTVIDIEDNQILNNTALGGGGIALNSSSGSYDIGTLIIKGNTIKGNESTGSGSADGGGGIYIYRGSGLTENTEIVIEGNTIDGNTSVKDGGGIYDYRGETELRENTITNNTAANGGGVAYFEEIDMVSGVITGNTASSQGGGVYISGSRGNFNMTGGSIYGNTAGSSSADLYVSKDSTETSMLPASEMDIDGYDGIGWFNDSKSARYVDTDDPEEIDVNNMPTGSFYYMIAAYGSTVTYSVDGDTSVVAPAIIDATKGETEVTLASGDDLEVPDGYCCFDSWNTAEDGSGDSYEGGATYSGPSVTLYAQFDEHDWTWDDEVEEDGDKTTIQVYFICSRCGAEVEDDIVVETTSNGIEVHTNLTWDELLSANDLAQIFEMFTDDEEIDITLDIEAMAEEQVPEEDVELIESVISQIGTQGGIFYMDIALNLTVTHYDEEVYSDSITETNQEITFTVKIPDELVEAEGDTYTVIRVHDGEAEALDTMDNGDGTLTFSSDKFSTYALVKTYEAEEVDKDALQAEYDADSELKESDYTEDSWATFEAAMEKAKDVLDDDDATQDEVDAALAELVAAREALQPAEAEKADKDALQAEYDADSELKESDYTEDSWATFKAAMEKAKEVLDDDDATQDEVDEALADLVAAREALQPAEAGKTDKNALQTEYDADKELEESKYTDDSWKAFEAAMENAKAVLDNDDATQEEVDAALAELVAAREALVEKETETEPNPKQNPDSGTKGTTGTTGSDSGSGNTGAAKTADTNNVGLWLLLLIASAAVAVTGFVVKRRQH